MNDDFEIEIQDDQDGIESHIQLPMNFLPIGEIENDDVKVYIKQDVYKSLEKYALSDISTELGTIILGDYSNELGKTHVIISDYIEAKYTDASASTLTFTHETWEYVHQQHETLYPNTKIVGWQHTHPSYGIFLSNYDLFIQENFFNLPFQVAYVIDPVQKLRGFFQWKNGKIEKLKGFYIYDEIGKPIKIEQPKEKKAAEAVSTKRQSNIIPTILLVFLLLCTAALGYATLQMGNEIKSQQRQYESLEAAVLDQGQSLTSLCETVSSYIIENDGEVTIQSVIQLIEQQQVTIEEQGQMIANLQEFVEQHKGDADAGTVEFIQYEVQPGDTLAKICKKFDIDISSNLSMIALINGIADVNMIYVGQMLLLPAQD